MHHLSERMEESDTSPANSNVELLEVKMEALGKSDNEPPFMKSSDELQSLSSVMRVFQSSWDDMQKHFQFIVKAIEEREKQLLTHVKSQEEEQQQYHSSKAVSIEETVSSIVGSEDVSEFNETIYMDPMEASDSDESPGLKAVKVSDSDEPSNTDALATCKYSSNKCNVQRQVPEQKENPVCHNGLLGSELANICKKMCGPGLRKYITSHLSDYKKLHKEIPAALKIARNPGRLVFECVGKFYLQGRKAFSKGSHMIAPRKAALFALEFFLMADCNEVEPSVKIEAENAAVAWRKRVIAECGLCNASHADAKGLLLFVSCFGIPNIFSNDDLVHLMRLSNPRGITEALRNSAFLVQRIHDIIAGMMAKRLLVEAVDVIYMFRLEHKFSPTRILMGFLKKLKEDCIAVKKETTNDPASLLYKANLKKLEGLKSVVNCLEAHKVDPGKLLPGLQLKDHIIRLEKDIADRAKRKLDEVNSSRSLEIENAKRAKVGETCFPSQSNGVQEPSAPSQSHGYRASFPVNSSGTEMGPGVLPGDILAGSSWPPYSAVRVQGERPVVNYESHVVEDRWTHDRLMAQGPPLRSATLRSHSFVEPFSSIEKCRGLLDRPSFGVRDRHPSSDPYQFADAVPEHEFAGFSSDGSRPPPSSSHRSLLC
ncbi:FRIGIDA-like protein [Drosera capensis]